MLCSLADLLRMFANTIFNFIRSYRTAYAHVYPYNDTHNTLKHNSAWSPTSEEIVVYYALNETHASLQLQIETCKWKVPKKLLELLRNTKKANYCDNIKLQRVNFVAWRGGHYVNIVTVNLWSEVITGITTVTNRQTSCNHSTSEIDSSSPGARPLGRFNTPVTPVSASLLCILHSVAATNDTSIWKRWHNAETGVSDVQNMPLKGRATDEEESAYEVKWLLRRLLTVKLLIYIVIRVHCCSLLIQHLYSVTQWMWLLLGLLIYY